MLRATTKMQCSVDDKEKLQVASEMSNMSNYFATGNAIYFICNKIKYKAVVCSQRQLGDMTVAKQVAQYMLHAVTGFATLRIVED